MTIHEAKKELMERGKYLAFGPNHCTLAQDFAGWRRVVSLHSPLADSALAELTDEQRDELVATGRALLKVRRPR